MEKSNIRQPIPVKTTNTATGEVIIWASIKQCARNIHVAIRSVVKAHYSKTIYRGYRFELLAEGDALPTPPEQRRVTPESPKDYVGRKSGKSSIKQLAQDLGITTDEVKKLFDEWLNDRRERGDWEQYQHLT